MTVNVKYIYLPALVCSAFGISASIDNQPKTPMKMLIKSILRALGLEVRRIRTESGTALPGSAGRPIGDIRMFLEDLGARGFRPRGIIDIGANRGHWTRMALSVFPEAQLLMIEPQREMRPLLETICGEFDSVEYVQAGAGREQGQLVQTIWNDLSGSSFLPAINSDWMHEDKQRLTQIVTLDQLLLERNGFTPDLVKLDIQGFELEALCGATTLFGITQVFIMETSLFQFMANMPTTSDCIAFMANREYELYDITEYLRRPSDGALGQIDLAFVPKNHPLRQSRHW